MLDNYMNVCLKLYAYLISNLLLLEMGLDQLDNNTHKRQK